MGIRVLGPLTVDGSGRLGPHDRVVLQALATRPGQSVSADELIDAVWGDHPPASAAKNLQSCVVKLRKVLGQETIETAPHGYVLAVPPDHVDAREFEAEVARARELLTVGESDRVAFLLEHALGLWRGPAFADLSDWPPARREAERLDELRLEAQEMRVDAMLRSGRPQEVLAEAQELVRAAPLRERRWELLVLAQYQIGAQGEALRSLRELRAVLSRELGIDPSSEMLALEQAILTQDPGLLVTRARPGTSKCPWQGLRAYDVDDADRFFGRDEDVHTCLGLLATGSFAALVGPSGSGKSSIMRAGVLAALRARGRPIVLITPTRRPSDSLTALPEDADPRTVLAVDQAEEVFTLCDDPDQRREFLDRLTREAAKRSVVVSLRGDRLSQVTEHPGFSRLVERGLQLVGSLDDEALRAAVAGPAAQAGLVLQPGLVELLVREVRDDPGALPLLSHTLMETWRRREGNTLTVDGYHASGGIHGAVAQSAEQLYASMAPEQRHLLRDLLLRLVSPGAEGEAVRTQVPRRLVASDPHHEQLIGMLVDARLVTSDDGVLEITHEALARAWPRLRGWLDDDVEGQRIRHHLSGASDAWDTLGRPDSELYRGVRLARALDWQARTDTTLTAVEHEFLTAGHLASAAEEQSAAERARAQSRLIRRLRVVLGGAVVLLVLALAAGGLAAVQSNRAGRNAAEARAAADTARQAVISSDARRVGLRSQLTDDISLSLLLAAAGARLDDSALTRANLVTALAARPLLVRSAPPAGGFLEVLVVSPDGRWIASSDDQNRMHLYDTTTNRLLRSYDGDPPPDLEQGFMLGAFSPDSRQLAVALETSASPEPVRLLDPTTMEQTTRLAFPGGPLNAGDVRFSANGRHLAANVFPPGVTCCPPGVAERRGMALVWDLRSPASAPARIPIGIGLQRISLSPDGRTLFTGWPLTAYDVRSGRQVWKRPDLRGVHPRPEPRGHPARGRAGRAPGAGRRRCDGCSAGWAAGRHLRHPVLPRRLPARFGLQRRRARRLGHRPPAGPWNAGTPSTPTASASARPTTSSTGAPPTRCSARGTCPRGAPTCSGRRRSPTPEVRARRLLPGRAPRGLQLARRRGQGMGQVRRHRHARCDSAHPRAGGEQLSLADRHLAPPRSGVRDVLQPRLHVRERPRADRPHHRRAAPQPPHPRRGALLAGVRRRRSQPAGGRRGQPHHHRGRRDPSP